MKILVTGSAGFIGFHLVKALLERGDSVVGLDNINSYYDVCLKYGRLKATGITGTELQDHTLYASTFYPEYRFIKMDITDKEGLFGLMATEKFDAVCHLAAQAGVRYSIENPYTYIQSNVVGYLNVLEACRNFPVNHLVYASSSSVYGMNSKVPYSEEDQVDEPVSLYAATKKADELMSYAYSKLYTIPSTGVRFFTVYGPWGRPDMAPYLFMDAILKGEKIRVFNNGNMERDFTYIDDIVGGLLKIIDHPASGKVPYKIYNIGNSSPVRLMDFIKTIEQITGKIAIKEFQPMQPGDVIKTFADTTRLETELGYKPSTSINAGIGEFYNWFVKENPLR